jgi:hypothetical protein
MLHSSSSDEQEKEKQEVNDFEAAKKAKRNYQSHLNLQKVGSSLMFAGPVSQEQLLMSPERAAAQHPSNPVLSPSQEQALFSLIQAPPSVAATAH